MEKDTVHIALFKDEQIDAVSEAITRLRQIGIFDQDMSVISGVPYSEKILGRPMSWTRIGLIAMVGALLGVIVSLLLNLGTPALYPIRVGGQPYMPIPTTIVLTFELGMLGLMLSTFLGVFVETITPTYGPKGYSPQVSAGKIGLLFSCKEENITRVHQVLSDLGAELDCCQEDKKL
jgi:hypothetical protein